MCWDLVESFIQAGCNPTTRNFKGNTALEAAIEPGHTLVVERLLSCNDPLPPDILLFALRKRSAPQIIQSLIRKGVNVHSTTSDGGTVLHLAITQYAERIYWDLVKNFIGAGCNPTACNSRGNTVLEAAVERGQTLVVDLLLSHNVPFPCDVILLALRHRLSSQTIQCLIRQGADVHSTTSDGDTVVISNTSLLL